jgi:phytoene dehydrogenase-like protein
VNIAGQERDWLPLHIFNHDPSMAPAGKTTITIMLPSSHDFWKSLDQDAYLAKKQEVASQIVKLLEQRFPGISGQVEMTDVSTPLTFERYTGNWQGSFEGWMITPENSGVLMKKMAQELPGLKNFYMCGQWVEPGGGLPTGIMSGKRLVKAMCKADRKKFSIIQ